MGSRSPQSDRASSPALARPTSFSSPYDRSSPPNPHTFNPIRRLFPTRRAVPRRSRLQAPFKPNALRIDSAIENSHEKKKKKKGLPDLLLMKASALSGHWYIDGWITFLHWTRCYVQDLFGSQICLKTENGYSHSPCKNWHDLELQDLRTYQNN